MNQFRLPLGYLRLLQIWCDYLRLLQIWLPPVPPVPPAFTHTRNKTIPIHSMTSLLEGIRTQIRIRPLEFI